MDQRILALRRSTVQCYFRYEGADVKFPDKKCYVTIEWLLVYCAH